LKHYLLIKSDCVSAAGARMSARESAMALINKGYWPLWEHTRNRRAIAAGDKIAIYLSGTGGSEVIATATVDMIAQWNTAFARGYPLVLDGTPFAVLLLAKVKILVKAVPVKERLARLSFINQGSPKWGVAFMGGTRAVSAADFAVLTGA